MDVSRPGPELEQRQRVGVGVAVAAGAGEEVAGARGGELGAGAGKWIKSAGSNRAKFSHRSQSSPSSLTTHKFGLRPTPSPPRLIIDHQTGDIVESYPQQPTYLRTYQPLEDEDLNDDDADDGAGDNDDDDDDDDDEEPITELSEDSQEAKQRRQLDEYKRLLRHRQDPSRQHQDEGFLSSQDELQHLAPDMNGQPHNRHYRPAIPPPHSGKVYFAPPSVSGSAHLFAASRRESFEGGPEVEPQVLSQHRPSTNSQSGSHNQSFKRALNKLSDAARTDIAILEPRGESQLEDRHRQGSPGKQQQQQPQIKVTATSASRANALLAHKSREPAQAKLAAPVIEHFRLYDICYQFRVLLVTLLSSLVVYLLAAPLYADCARHRPTLTYVSLILACVNLTCILIFTLFWYCSGVTRTLYANLSSSAFIVTIYSILVALNLALGVLFFFANTCHFQRLMETPLALGLVEAPSHLPEPFLLPSLAGAELEPRIIRRRDHSSPAERPEERNTWRARRSGEDDEGAVRAGERGPRPEEEEPSWPPPAPSMSPLEAAWEWSCEQVRALGRHFRHFLMRYDLRFVGALHALCAVCLQYMAMRVAVVRSHFCSPVAHYL